MLYNLLKFLHDAGVIVWVGGQVTVGVLNARVARERQASVRAPLAQATRFFGGAVAGPATLVTLVAGIGMVAVGDLSFATLWISWGLAGILVSGLLGGTVIRRAGEQLGSATRHDPPDPGRITMLQARLRALNLLNLVVLFSVVWAMVFKPTL